MARPRPLPRTATWALLCLALLVVAVACGKAASDAAPPPPPPPSTRADRVEATAAPTAGANPGVEIDPQLLAGFCDKHWPGSGAGVLPFGAGPLATAQPGARVGKGGWRWINFWATWCKPCLEEMPMLARWRDALVKEELDFTLELWSVDEDASALQAWMAKGSPAPVWQVQSAEALGDWLAAVGADRDAVLPIHVLVDPKGQLRCVRLGSVRPADWGTVRKLVGR